MKKSIIVFILLQFSWLASSQQSIPNSLSYKMEELTSPQFIKAVQISKGICVIPLGILEKHGAHLPIGTDLIEAREIVFKAAEKEYAVVYPPYFAGQIFVAKAHPGTIAYSNDLIWKLLEETCMELSRNGLKKIILYNSHGGNTLSLKYFCQSQLSSRKDYIVVLFEPGDDSVLDKEIKSLKKTKIDGHAGEEETSMIYYINHALVDKDRISDESGADLDRLSQLRFGFTSLYWYARFPNHYAGDGSQFSSRLGELLIQKESIQLAELIRFLKKSNKIEEIQEEFYNNVQNPVK
jgi:creatinine amidohydrolase